MDLHGRDSKSVGDIIMWQRTGIVVVLVAAAIWPESQVKAAGEAETRPLKLKVGTYSVKDVSIAGALQELKARVLEKNLIVTLEVAPFERKPEENITVAVSDCTVKEVLDRITRLDPRYSYSVFRGGLIHVFPVLARDDANDLLNTKVKAFTTSGVPYDRLLQYPNYYIPELGAELLRRSKAGGVAVSELSSTGVPGVTVEVRNATVRDILNQISLNAAKVAKSPVVPTGWVYTFRVDKSVPLGGHPRWSLF
jgi:hypothetical protein